ncbi:C40 family peptidase [Tahibacter amnicola]|uniref:C40 family peptidase n=1 Tax=Tahibacter amnicola TaxID=2976241 RepID=A0ABY6BJU1_9GAMM|nr:C40 family peptidase [Tahibacter amnicola]UXI69871.1 C40 family peptidase [Tahibacter amnicola]
MTPVHRAAGALLMVLAALLATGCGRRDTVHIAGPRVPASPNDILFRAISLVGTPYRFGGNTPEGGFDCSGLVGYVFSDVAGLALPHSADAISRVSAESVRRSHLAPGDLVFFKDGRDVSHVGIYVGEGRFVHAPSSGGTVRLDPLDGDYWKDHYFGARRLLK